MSIARTLFRTLYHTGSMALVTCSAFISAFCAQLRAAAAYIGKLIVNAPAFRVLLPACLKIASWEQSAPASLKEKPMFISDHAALKKAALKKAAARTMRSNVLDGASFHTVCDQNDMSHCAARPRQKLPLLLPTLAAADDRR